MDGRCSECGLDFHWRDVLSPRFSMPGWCVEYGPLSGVPLRLCRTMRTMINPFRFWRELQMHHDPGWSRMPALLAAIIIAGYLAFAVSCGIATWYWANRSAAIANRTSLAWLDGLQAAIMPWADVTNTIRGPMPASVRSVFKWNRIAYDGWHEVRFSVDSIWGSDHRRIIPHRSFECICTLLACPVGFLLLPISRRLAKVRWSHIARISMYGMMLSIFVIWLDF